MADDTFHPFPRLPIELRHMIWRLCLPHRVSEYDLIVNWVYYNTYSDDALHPCQFASSIVSNGRPPLLTRVCHESRQIAFETGEMGPKLTTEEKEAIDLSGEPEWSTGTNIQWDVWKDSVRDSTHLSWDGGHQINLGYTTRGHPLVSLAREAKRLNGKASFMVDYIQDLMYSEPDDEPLFPFAWAFVNKWPVSEENQKNLAALKLLPEWLVVVNVIVIHLAFPLAAKTGLFGLLGEEVVQVVDAASPLATQLYELAEACERQAEVVTAAQDFARMPAEYMDDMVKRGAFKCFHDYEIPYRLRPAIMFRLCTEMCNHSDRVKKEQTV
ncbi:hypothetical protein D6C90_01193 [Aureobasidium pullulans]|uniref:2EXR domain-containing protein n=1 Tax=Aureobasidium pullulans TaxID=5580 RepID=A0A4S9VJN2_AURPU|nr:hypothetical protein D6C90_01193 [Aureobasidium pullulans]